jgi:tRNA nucleotidyltransferase (CCA-adding enzyme)
MSMERFLSVKVRDLMTKKVVNIDAGMTANEVARLIVEYKIEGFPVTEKGKLVGIITGWDLVTKVVSKGLKPNKVKVKEFMTPSPIICSPNDSVLEAAKIMAKYGIKRIPVVENGKVVGFFTSYDITVYRRIIDYADFSRAR